MNECLFVLGSGYDSCRSTQILCLSMMLIAPLHLVLFCFIISVVDYDVHRFYGWVAPEPLR